MKHPEDILKAKGECRRSLRLALSRLDDKQRQLQSQALCDRASNLPEWRSAGRVMLFYPMTPEPDILPLWGLASKQGKTTFLPRFNPASKQYEAAEIPPWQPDIPLPIGAFGIPEPSQTAPLATGNRLDFIVIPGVGFCTDGRRLGRGGGFYDRLLAHLKGFRCGVAYEEQIVEDLPVEPHDIRCDCILTPSTGWRNHQ